jgi:hypothetical protein
VSASRSHFDTAGPGRRQRASAGHGFELHAPALRAEGEEEGRKITAPRRGRSICLRTRRPGLSPTPSVRSGGGMASPIRAQRLPGRVRSQASAVARSGFSSDIRS